MKRKKLSAREVVLLIILIVLAVFAAYIYGFQKPMQEKMDHYKSLAAAADDELIVAEAKIVKLQKMEKELKDIIEAGNLNSKEIPNFDNSENVMVELSAILEKTLNYEVQFLGTSEKDGIVRRNINLSYFCQDYENAKNVLEKIYDGKYRCLLKDLHVRQSNGKCNVSVTVTYFEYK